MIAGLLTQTRANTAYISAPTGVMAPTLDPPYADTEAIAPELPIAPPMNRAQRRAQAQLEARAQRRVKRKLRKAKQTESPLMPDIAAY